MGEIKTLIKTHHVNQVTRVDETEAPTVDNIQGTSYKRPNRPEDGQFEPPANIQPQQQQHFQGFRVLGKRTFAAATSLIAIVGLMSLAKYDSGAEEQQPFTPAATGFATTDEVDSELTKLVHTGGAAEDYTMADHQLVYDLHQNYVQSNKALEDDIVVQPRHQIVQSDSFNVWKAPDLTAPN